MLKEISLMPSVIETTLDDEAGSKGRRTELIETLEATFTN